MRNPKCNVYSRLLCLDEFLLDWDCNDFSYIFTEEKKTIENKTNLRGTE